jgi:hypothetical protein
MKKAVLIFFTITFFALAGYLLYKFHSYTITEGCVFITKEIKDGFRIEKYLSAFEHQDRELCEDPFIVDLSLFSDNSEKRAIEVSHNGLSFFVGTVIPSKKEDVIPGEESDEKEKVAEKTGEVDAFDSFLTSRGSDVSIYYILTENHDDFTQKEVEESAVTLQSKVDKIDIMITDMFEIPAEKKIRDNSLAVGINEKDKTALIQFSIIRNRDDLKMIIFKKTERFPF